MRDLDKLEHHPLTEQVVKVLIDKTQSNNPLFFRVLVAYYFAKIASMMRCTIKSAHSKQPLPINVYAVNLAVSGAGKGMSTDILEEQVLNQFRERFIEETLPIIAEGNLPKIAHKRAARKGTDPDDELERIQREYDALGPFPFSFDSGTVPAVKQMRHKLLMAGAGSICFEMDEMGSNLLGNADVLTLFLELFDGKAKQKLVKDTADSKRSEEIHGKTPTNMLLFGTPSKLLSGGKVEDEFYSMLDTGYARRCIFGYSRENPKNLALSADEIYDMLTATDTDTFIEDLSDQIGELADMINFNKSLTVSREVSLHLIEYKLHCEKRAYQLGDHNEIRKSEMAHRFFKTLKLAGAYAFIDGSHEITEDHLYNAIALIEASGDAFDKLLTRDRPYVKLAKYIADVGREVTHVDMMEDLPFYPKAASQRSDMLSLAITYGYQNNIIIKKSFQDGIEFLSGESLKETDLDEMIISYGTHAAFNYMNEKVPFDKLDKLTQADGYHWVNHHVVDGHRCEDKMVSGFNMVVIDVDGEVDLSTAQLLLKDYKALYYTTKSHTPQVNRFRIMLPISHVLKLDSKDFKEFMNNIYEWLPFECDDGTGQLSRKWASHTGSCQYIDGDLLDALQFIPKTTRNDERKQRILDTQSLSNLERWFVNHTGSGNRNKQLLKYAMVLVDAGKDWNDVRHAVVDLNQKIPDKLDESEIMATIMSTVSKAISQREVA